MRFFITGVWLAFGLMLSGASLAMGQLSSDAMPASQTPPQISHVETAESKLAIAERELQVSRDFTQHILATVYFCLGTVIVVLFTMIGFGWYQNVRAYERDKEALRQSLSKTLAEMMKAAESDLNRSVAERFLELDSKMAKAIGTAFKRIDDLQLFTSAEIFRVIHFSKTPETDLEVLRQHTESSIGKVSIGALNEALSVMLDHLENLKHVNNRTAWLSLAEKLPPDSAGYAARLREILTIQKMV